MASDLDRPFVSRQLIAQNPRASRRKLSVLVCQAWDWRQTNGAWRDMLCRGLMPMLHRAGHIELPPPRQFWANPLTRRAKPATDFLVDQTPLPGPLSALLPLAIRHVRRTGEEDLFNGLLERYHYLGYTRSVGEHLKYLVGSRDRPVACLAWSSGPWHMGPRDRFIGWTPAVRRRNLHLLAYNTRFLILPWARVPHLASHILGRIARVISADRRRLYGHPVHCLETFVDRERFHGTCYRAANWVHLGQMRVAQGRDRHGPLSQSHRSAEGRVDPAVAAHDLRRPHREDRHGARPTTESSRRTAGGALDGENCMSIVHMKSFS
jgi:hypothetical protein